MGRAKKRNKGVCDGVDLAVVVEMVMVRTEAAIGSVGDLINGGRKHDNKESRQMCGCTSVSR